MSFIKEPLEVLVKILFSYPAIAIGSGTATGLGIWHAIHTDDYHIEGQTTTFAGIESDEYRKSLALMTVFTQVCMALDVPRANSNYIYSFPRFRMDCSTGATTNMVQT